MMGAIGLLSVFGFELLDTLTDSVVRTVAFIVLFFGVSYFWRPQNSDFWMLTSGSASTKERNIGSFIRFLVKTAFIIIAVIVASLIVALPLLRAWNKPGIVVQLTVAATIILSIGFDIWAREWNPFHIGAGVSLLCFTVLGGLSVVSVQVIPVVGEMTYWESALVAFPVGVFALIGVSFDATSPSSVQVYPATGSVWEDIVSLRSKIFSTGRTTTVSDDQTVSGEERTARNGGRADEDTHGYSGERSEQKDRGSTEEFRNSNFQWEQPPDTTFDDIGGYEDIKQELVEDVIAPATAKSERYERFDVEPDKGVLLHGPPGTGKTLFARAIANQLNRPFVELNQSDIGTAYVNESANVIGDVFSEAQARGGVVFIDEAETLFRTRTQSLDSNEDAKVTNTFLSEVARDDKNFVVILATNREDLIDDAAKRPGRIDKSVKIGKPNHRARYQIAKQKLEGIPVSFHEKKLKAFTEEIEGATGADIEQIISGARRKAATEGADSVSMKHIRQSTDF